MSAIGGPTWMVQSQAWLCCWFISRTGDGGHGARGAEAEIHSVSGGGETMQRWGSL